MKVLTVVGNRPQFIKLGVTERALRLMGAAAPYRSVVINTGQHYDEMLSDVFFTELEIEPPAHNLAMGSGHIVDQIGKMMVPLREIVMGEKPNAILVYGDTNSTVAAAIVAAHLDVPCIHVEAGERLYRRREMPEEINRIATDHLSELCLASSRKAERYLAREGFAKERVRFVGDPMYDLFLLAGRMLADRSAAQPADFGLMADEYGLATLHRAENTDDKKTCLGILEALDHGDRPVLLPVHPRLRARLNEWDWEPKKSLKLTDSLGYFDFQSLLRQSGFLVTDSGGVGREAFFAGKPAIIPLESSAWIEAVEAGLAVMTGHSPDRIAAAISDPPRARDVKSLIVENFGAGDAGEHIVAEVAAFLSHRGASGEGPWHSLGRFESLPKAENSLSLALANFAEVARTLGERPHGRCVIDITGSLASALDLAIIAREKGCAILPFLDARAALYNPFQAHNADAIRGLCADGRIAIADSDGARATAQALGLVPVPINRDDIPGETDGKGALQDLATMLADEVSITQVIVKPWLWGQYPISPFESAMRLDDHSADLTSVVARIGGG